MLIRPPKLCEAISTRTALAIRRRKPFAVRQAEMKKPAEAGFLERETVVCPLKYCSELVRYADGVEVCILSRGQVYA